MFEITDLIADFKGLTLEAYLDKHAYPVLLHQTNPGDATSDKSFQAGLKRAEDRRSTVMASDPAAVETARSATGILVFPLRPRPDSSDPGRVSVGRAPDNDVRLPYDKVSGRHVYFASEGDRWIITDDDATNGTFVNDGRLDPQAPTQINSGSKLKLGTAELTFYNASDFYDYLMGLMAMLKT